MNVISNFAKSPYLQNGMGLVRLDRPDFLEQDTLSVPNREAREHPIELVSLPFYNPEKRMPRGHGESLE